MKIKKLLFILLLVCPIAQATTWYVTTSGSNSNPCTLASPCATPDHAENTVAAPGDTVSVGAGTYDSGTTSFQFTTAGTSGNPITVKCATRGACHLQAHHNSSGDTIVVVYLNTSFITLDGFEISGLGSAGMEMAVYVVGSNTSVIHNTIHDIISDCSSMGGGGVQVAVSNITNIVVDSNLIYNINWSGGSPTCNSSTVQFDGVLMEQTGFTTTSSVTNNIIYNISGGWGAATSTNALIAFNTIFNTVNGGVVINNAPSGATVEDNIIVYTGILASDGLRYGGACAIQNGTSSSTTYGYNDLAGNRDGSNVLGANYGTGFGCNTGGGLNTGDITADPAGGTVFINWQQNGSGDYHEKTGSPTIAAGINVGVTHDYDGNTRPSGSGYDMGAYQFTASCNGTDNFPGAGTALSSCWTNTSAGGYVACKQNSGNAIPNTASSQCLAVYTGTSPAVQQYSQVVVSSSGSGNGSTGPCVLMTVAGNGYCWLTGSNVIYIITGGGGGGNTGASCPTPSAGDTLQLIANNGALTCKDVTSGLSGSATNTTYTTGQPGILVDQRTGSANLSAYTGQTLTALTINPTTGINGTTGNIVNLTGLNTNWTAGTPGSPTFTISGGGPTITAQTVINSTSAQLTINAGTVNGNYTITDPSTGNTAIYTVRNTITYYVNHIGGTRYSSNNTSGQCNGTANVAYPGSGVNQNCAFQDIRALWTDFTYNASQSFPGWGWVLGGGDTAIVTDCIQYPLNSNTPTPGSSGPCRIGWNGDGTGTNPGFGGLQGINTASPPSVPSGAPGHPTQILGVNYASCSSAGAKTKLHSGYGTGGVFSLSNTSYANIECFDLTDWAQCTLVGSSGSFYPSACSKNAPIDDYGQTGIGTNQFTTNVIMQDLNIHGFTADGLFGPYGAAITMTRVNVNFNGNAGWEFDDGNATANGANALITATDVTMEGNGCNEEYPIVHSFPAISCYDSNSGGFGDAWSAQGTGAGGQTSQGSLICLRCKIFLNTKDGFGMNHVLYNTLTITDSISYANSGQQWKWSSYDNGNVTFANNLTVTNCNRFNAPIPGSPYSYSYALGSGPGAYLSAFCRAGGDGIALGAGNNSTTLIYFNTLVGYAATTFDVSCSSPTVACGSETATLNFKNNIFLGYSNPGYNGGTLPGAIFFGTGVSFGALRSYNIWQNMRNAGCPSTGYTGELCVDPLFVGEPASPMTAESNLDNFNFNLSNTSPAIHTGNLISGFTTDYNGTNRPNPPSMGALEPSSTPPPAFSLQFSGKFSKTGSLSSH